MSTTVTASDGARQHVLYLSERLSRATPGVFDFLCVKWTGSKARCRSARDEARPTESLRSFNRGVSPSIWSSRAANIGCATLIGTLSVPAYGGIGTSLHSYVESDPSIDPELMIRMLIVGYCFGIRSGRRLCEEVDLNLAYRGVPPGLLPSYRGVRMADRESEADTLAWSL
jgi:hypothetical protein